MTAKFSAVIILVFGTYSMQYNSVCTAVSCKRCSSDQRRVGAAPVSYILFISPLNASPAGTALEKTHRAARSPNTWP